MAKKAWKSGERNQERPFRDLPNHLRIGEELHCVFYTLVVRNEPLKNKWPGGLIDYWEKYEAVHNDKITASCFMGPYWDEQYKELVENGLVAKKDFLLFDASDVIMIKDFTPFQMSVDWLDGYVLNAGVMIFMKH